MPQIDKKYYHNIDLDLNELKSGRLHNLTSSQRTGLSLTTADKGYLVFDTTVLSLYVWDGTQWLSTIVPTVNTDFINNFLLMGA
mgnify:CR=1 FL=1